MSTVAVAPQTGDERETVLAGSFTMRIQCLDVATGEPVTDAYALTPFVDRSLLERRNLHPFRVLTTRNVAFLTYKNRMREVENRFALPVRDLRTWIPATATQGPTADAQMKLEETWVTSGEFVQPHPSGLSLKGPGSTVFQRIDAIDERYIRVKDDTKLDAQRDLITNRDGVLEIPLSFGDWFRGGTHVLVLRDHLMVLAEGAFAPDELMQAEDDGGFPSSRNGHRALLVKLNKIPADNAWTATSTDGTTRYFESKLEMSLPPRSRKGIDFTVWLVHRVGSNLASNAGANEPSGIMVHYTSAFYAFEQRIPAAEVKSREAFVKTENDYMMRTEMATAVVNASGAGYHYIIARNGTIHVTLEERTTAWHAGKSLEPPKIIAFDDAKQKQEHSITDPRSWLNRHYIGISLIGNHIAARFYFTAAQHWYLDRLVSNIQERLKVKWYHILGHDEVRERWNQHNSANKGDTRRDPGAALRGENGKDPPEGVRGIALLRGRHGAFTALDE